jgi:hypothetical protein
MNAARTSTRFLADGRLDLPEVTLVAASSKPIAATIRALRLSLAQIRPARAILFSNVLLEADVVAGVDYVKVPKMDSREAYSRFVLKDLADHVATDFVLCVQWDGYVLDAQNWSEEFLEVDYVGAPWPQFDDGYDVGNGGFSLRSLRLLRACQDERVDPNAPEDLAICRQARPWLEGDYGIRFADRDLARRFAYERTAPNGDEFGFHGAFNMAGIMSPAEYRQLLSSLDQGVLRRSDKVEHLKDAFKRLDFASARLMLRSMLPGSGEPAPASKRDGL